MARLEDVGVLAYEGGELVQVEHAVAVEVVLVEGRAARRVGALQERHAAAATTGCRRGGRRAAVGGAAAAGGGGLEAGVREAEDAREVGEGDAAGGVQVAQEEGQLHLKEVATAMAVATAVPVAKEGAVATATVTAVGGGGGGGVRRRRRGGEGERHLLLCGGGGRHQREPLHELDVRDRAALVGVCRSARGVRRVMTLPQASRRYGPGLPWSLRTLARGGGSRFEPQSPRTEEGEEPRGVAGGRRLEAERGDELRLLEQPVARGVERVEALEQLRHAWRWQAADAPRRGRTRLVAGGGASASGAPPRWGAS